MLKNMLTFVLPAYNEEDKIVNTLHNLDEVVKNNVLPYEVVVVNDGSKDRTLKQVMFYAKQNDHVKVVSYDKNMGKGHAIKAGFKKATGDIVILTDSDSEIDMSTISQYIIALKRSDMVIASKWHPNSQVKIPIVRKILSHGFSKLVNLFTGTSLTDTQSGLKAIKKSAFINIFSRLSVKRYAFDVELLSVANLYGLKIIEMPVKINMNVSFKLKDIFKMFIDLLGISYRLRIIHWYTRKIPNKNRLQKLYSNIFRD